MLLVLAHVIKPRKIKVWTQGTSKVKAKEGELTFVCLFVCLFVFPFNEILLFSVSPIILFVTVNNSEET